MFVFNTGLGRVMSYAELPGGDDWISLSAFQVSPLLDDELLNVATLAALTGVLTEGPGFGRVDLSSSDVWTDSSLATAYLYMSPGWVAPAAGPQITRVVISYKPLSTSPDSDIIPLVSLDVDFTPDDFTNLSLDLSTDGFFHASGYTYV